MKCHRCNIEIVGPWVGLAVTVTMPALGSHTFCGYQCAGAHILGMLPDATVRLIYWKTMGAQDEYRRSVLQGGEIQPDREVIETLRFYADPQVWERSGGGPVETENGTEYSESTQPADLDKGDTARAVLADLGVEVDDVVQRPAES